MSAGDYHSGGWIVGSVVFPPLATAPFSPTAGAAPNGPLCPLSLLRRIEALEALVRELRGEPEEIKAGLTD